MRLRSDESGATKTEYGIIAAGMSFAVAVAALPQDATFMHSLAACRARGLISCRSNFAADWAVNLRKSSRR
jgi:Flp pilus assembly pilin Flp